ncbi:MAG TPA: zinc ribbon domain-containing protein [Chthonomonadales bacterium]|nr:zinc ribbon domain-containing protein [Chthonomonadales bacterium]
MTAPACPICRTPLREGAAFCGKCGLEVYQRCPACTAGRLALATLSPMRSPWCDSCRALLLACEQCGRWLTPAQRICPDHTCGGRVLPTQPCHTGRRWDGRGSGASWEWPTEWESANPDRVRPLIDPWESAEPVYAACVAHGRLLVWEGATLCEPAGGHGAPEGEVRVPLIPGAVPARHVPHACRLAVVADGVVLASGRGFLLAPTRPDGEARLLAPGEPVTQVGAPGWWSGWLEEPGGPAVLLYAATGERWHTADVLRAPAPPESRPLAGARMAARDAVVYWPGADGGVWRLTCDKGAVDRVGGAGDGMVIPWADTAGPHWACEDKGIVRLMLSPGVTATGGAGPLRSVHAVQGTVVLVVGDSVWVFNVANGELLHNPRRPRGRLLDAVLAHAPDNEPRLLSLTREETSAALVALRPSSGAQDHLWHAPVDARYLLCAGEHLCVVHDRGVVRLRRAPAP